MSGLEWIMFGHCRDGDVRKVICNLYVDEQTVYMCVLAYGLFICGFMTQFYSNIWQELQQWFSAFWIQGCPLSTTMYGSPRPSFIFKNLFCFMDAPNFRKK